MLLKNSAGCRVLIIVIAVALTCGPASAGDAEYDHEAIGYRQATPQNAVTELQRRLAAGDAKLVHDDTTGWLRSVLRELKVEESSQMLVYSKTSLQRSRISPETPRAIYFNDDVYLGFCRNGAVIEVTAADPELGAVFYTIDQHVDDHPVITRQVDDCVACHASSAHTDGVPGHVVRSVYADARGLPILSAGSFHIDSTSPIEQRWGGWYVTGTHGEQQHLGNLIADDEERPGRFLPENLNVTSVADRFDATSYLTPHSDIVALMVLEHQTAMHNAITQANYATKRALWDEKVLDEAFNDSPDSLRESTLRRINNAAETVVECLLFSGEAKLTDAIAGTSGFAKAFAAQGPRDTAGRSLRDFDLKSRIFKYPCSYLIYSQAFDGLPDVIRSRIYERLFEILTGNEDDKTFLHLSSSDRAAILEILRETKGDLAESWHESLGANRK